jgi:K+-sensing histidine kinase KdpD
MIINFGVAPGLRHEQFIPLRLQGLVKNHSSDIVILHLPESQQDHTLPFIFFPENETLWNEDVLQKVLALRPRLVIIPKLYNHTLTPETHQIFLSNIRRLLKTGVVVETALAASEIARVNDLLVPHVPIPQENTITGDFLRAHVGDYVVHDMPPHEIMALFYNQGFQLPSYLRGWEDTLFNIPNLIRLRELMLRFVSAHHADITRSLNLMNVQLQKQPTWMNWKKTFNHILAAIPANMLWFVVVMLLWTNFAFPLPAVCLLLLAGPVVTALYVNPPTALIITMFTFVGFNQLFMPGPLWDVSDPSRVFTFGTFLFVTMATSLLVARHHMRQQQGDEQALQLSALFRLSYDMAYAETVEDAVKAALGNLKRTFNIPTVLLDSHGKPWDTTELRLDLTGEEQALAAQAIATGSIITPQKNENWLWCPLVVRQSVLGVIGLKTGPRGQASAMGTAQLLRSYSDILSTALRRVQLREASEDATQEAERESLRATLLSAISHDLKTPLVSIIGSLSTLKAVGQGLPEDYRNELLQTASEEAERLHTIIHNVLELTRFESGTVKPNLTDVELSSVLLPALTRCNRYYPGMKITIQGDEPSPWVKTDPMLLEEVICNIIYNAAKYAGPQNLVEISMQAEDQKVYLSIADNGPGILEIDRERVFDKYYRASQKDNRNAGSGLGLAICRAMMEACGSRIWADSRPDGKSGAVLVLELPQVNPVQVKEAYND